MCGLKASDVREELVSGTGREAECDFGLWGNKATGSRQPPVSLPPPASTGFAVTFLPWAPGLLQAM